MSTEKNANKTTATIMSETTIDIAVRITAIHLSGPVIATASVSLADCFVVRGVKLINGDNGVFVAMPSYMDAESGKYKHHCYPSTQELRENITKAVIDAYESELNRGTQH